MKEEEARETEPADQPELLVEPLAGFPLVPVRMGVPLPERPLADTPQDLVGRLLAICEVRIAVAELLRQVEREPPG